MNVYGDLAFELRVFVMSWPKEVLERRGETRRRGTGRAIGVVIWEGMVGSLEVG
jgi:hypothetical protein